MDVANVKTYDDSASNRVTDLFAEGPQTIPEPSAALLIALSGAALTLRRSRP